jgi:hypothetical protein
LFIYRKKIGKEKEKEIAMICRKVDRSMKVRERYSSTEMSKEGGEVFALG